MIHKISLAEIESKKTERGGWTKSTLEGWGISWPPPKGWKEALVAGEKVGFSPMIEPESAPDSVEAKLLHGLVMEIVGAGLGHILTSVDGLDEFYNCGMPSIADIVEGRPKAAILTGGLEWDDKVYSFSVSRMVK